MEDSAGYRVHIVDLAAACATVDGRTNEETSQGKGDVTHQRPTAHPSCIVHCPPRTRLFQGLPIEQLALNGELEVENTLVINDWWLRRLQIPLRCPFRIFVRFGVLNWEKYWE